MLKNHKKYVAYAIIATIYIFVSSVNASEKISPPINPKFIFLMIGDGMGTAQRAAAEMYKRLDTKSAVGEEKGLLIMNQFPVKGLTTTQPFDGLVTDSAAAATALACGEKTKNGIVSISSNLKTNLKSVAYYAKESGKKVGIVSCLYKLTMPPLHVFMPVNQAAVTITILLFKLSKSGFNYFAGGIFL